MPTANVTAMTPLAAPAATADKEAIMRQRILATFEQQARTVGPRSVSISALVCALGISSKTLYQHFDNKAHIVTELMAAWAQHWFTLQQQGLSAGLGPKQRIEVIAIEWTEHMARFSTQFWQQLERDFPAAFRLYQQQYQSFLKNSRHNLVDAVRADLDPQLALSTLMRMIQHAANPQLCEQLNLTRRDALRQVIDLWAQGAFKKALLC